MKRLTKTYFMAAIILSIGTATGAYFGADAQQGQIAFSTGWGVLIGAISMPLIFE